MDVYLEVADRRAFACAADWPGWERSGKNPEDALASWRTRHPRYAAALRTADIEVPPPEHVDVIEEITGGAGTDFGVPSGIAECDRRSPDDADLGRFVGILEAGWSALDLAVAAATGPLSKGPRGGGRELPDIEAHVLESERAYAPKIGIRLPAPEPTDRRAVIDHRHRIIDGVWSSHERSMTWPIRYFVRRVAWHALDHAWEIEDRSPAG